MGNVYNRGIGRVVYKLRRGGNPPTVHKFGGGGIKRLVDTATPLIEKGIDKLRDNRLQRAKKMGFDMTPEGRLYHASKQDITEFKPGYSDGLIFTTPDPEFANQWLGKGKFQERQGGTGTIEEAKKELKDFKESFNKRAKGLSEEKVQALYEKEKPILRQLQKNIRDADSVIYPLVTRTKSPFIPHKDAGVLEELFGKEKMNEKFGGDFPTYRDALKSGNYLLYENKEVVDFLKSKGYDSMFLKENTYTKENIQSPNYSTFAVFDPKMIRSPFAKFNPEDVDSSVLLKAKGGLVHKFGAGGIKRLVDTATPLIEKGVDKISKAVSEAELPAFFRAYHGSPYDFDKFDISKEGTGTGTQAYGRGLYLAEQEPTAQYYRGATTERNPDFEEYLLKEFNKAEQTGNYGRMEMLESALLHDTPTDFRNKSVDTDYDEDYRKMASDFAEEMEAFRDSKGDKVNFGKMYEVDVQTPADTILDYDKRLSEQSDFVKKALGGNPLKDKYEIKEESYPYGTYQKFGFADKETGDIDEDSYKPFFDTRKEAEEFLNDPTGDIIYEEIAGDIRYPSYVEGDKSIKNFLEKGIKGIKFELGDPRTGKQTPNFVIFDDALLDIKRKYKQGGSVYKQGIGTLARTLGNNDQVQKLGAGGLGKAGTSAYKYIMDILDKRAEEMEKPVAKRIQPDEGGYFSKDFTPALEFDEAPPVPGFKKGMIYPLGGRVKPLIDNMDAIVDDIVERSRPYLDSDVRYFYHMGPVLQKARELNIPEKKIKAWINDFSDYVAATSPRTQTDQNVRNAALTMAKEKLGINPREVLGVGTIDKKTGKKGLSEKGYPQMLGKGSLQGKLIDRVRSGEGIDPMNNPKPFTFGLNIKGNLEGVTADTHAIRGVLLALNRLKPGSLSDKWISPPNEKQMEAGDSLAKRKKQYKKDPKSLTFDMLEDTLVTQTKDKKGIQAEYSVFSDIYKKVAKKLGVTPAEAQAMSWFSGGDITNLGSEHKTLSQILEDRISVTAKATGKTKDQVFKSLVSKRTPLLSVSPLLAPLLFTGRGEPETNPEPEQFNSGGLVQKLGVGSVPKLLPFIERGVEKVVPRITELFSQRDSLLKDTQDKKIELETKGGIKYLAKRKPPELLVTHNLTSKGLKILDEDLGGQLPMPSLAVLDVDSPPLDNFGKITLIGDRTLATPSKEIDIYPTDIFSGRTPKKRFVLTRENIKEGKQKLRSDPIFNRFDPDQILGTGRMTELYMGPKRSFEDADEDMKTIQFAMRRYGLVPQDFSNYAELLREARSLTKNDKSLNLEDVSNTFKQLEGLRRYTNPEARIEGKGEKLLKKEYTLDEVERIMKREKRYEPAKEELPTETGGAVAKFRAVASPKFKNLEDVRASRGMIIDREQDTKVIQAFSDRYRKLKDEIQAYFQEELGRKYNIKTEDDYYKLPEGVEKTEADIVKIMDTLARGKSVREDMLPKYLQAKVIKLAEDSKDLPTNYFEIKSRGTIGLDKFKAALIPDTGDKEQIINTLSKYGIKDIYLMPSKKFLKQEGIDNQVNRYSKKQERALREIVKKSPNIAFSLPFLLGGISQIKESNAEKFEDGGVVSRNPFAMMGQGYLDRGKTDLSASKSISPAVLGSKAGLGLRGVALGGAGLMDMFIDPVNVSTNLLGKVFGEFQQLPQDATAQSVKRLLDNIGVAVPESASDEYVVAAGRALGDVVLFRKLAALIKTATKTGSVLNTSLKKLMDENVLSGALAFGFESLPVTIQQLLKESPDESKTVIPEKRNMGGFISRKPNPFMSGIPMILRNRNNAKI